MSIKHTVFVVACFCCLINHYAYSELQSLCIHYIRAVLHLSSDSIYNGNVILILPLLALALCINHRIMYAYKVQTSEVVYFTFVRLL